MRLLVLRCEMCGERAVHEVRDVSDHQPPAPGGAAAERGIDLVPLQRTTRPAGPDGHCATITRCLTCDHVRDLTPRRVEGTADA